MQELHHHRALSRYKNGEKFSIYRSTIEMLWKERQTINFLNWILRRMFASMINKNILCTSAEPAAYTVDIFIIAHCTFLRNVYLNEGAHHHKKIPKKSKQNLETPQLTPKCY